MDILIVKLGAAGDVVRTTVLLRAFSGQVTWLTDEKHTVLLQDVAKQMRCFSWKERNLCGDKNYDLVINLEDSLEAASHVAHLDYLKLWGAMLGSDNSVAYTDDSACWFDLSIVSRHGRHRADQLKLANRASYQELIFRGLGLAFSREPYLLPQSLPSPLVGDVAIAPEAGTVWPMKKWAYYNALRQELEAAGLTVNFLPHRPSLVEHLADVQAHRCLVSGDTLPMHLALGSAVPCVSIFTCTSPWEICDYGIQTKIVSPLLEEFFYKRGYDKRATAVTVDEVFAAVMDQLQRTTAAAPVTAK